MEALMNVTTTNILPHPNYLEMLFAHKSAVNHVVKDVLGLYDVDHVAVSHINHNKELLTLSSTPSLEFNLFSSKLWRFDRTYQPNWYNTCATSSWQSLYTPERYDELYYLKQIKHHYPIGLSFAVKLTNTHVIYSIACRNDCELTRDVFTNQHANLYKIGEYCSQALLPLISS